MTKILHVINSLDDGGAERVLFNICSFSKNNVHVLISLKGDGKYGKKIRSLGINVYCLNFEISIRSVISIIDIFKIIKLENPDVVQTWLYHSDLLGGVVGKICGVKKIVWGIRNTELTYGVSKTHTIIVAKICAIASYVIPDKIICCAKKSEIYHIKKGYKKEKFKVIYNGYNYISYNSRYALGKKIRKENRVNNDEILLGMVARYDPYKGHDILLSALSIVINLYKKDNIKCALVGKGIDKNNVPLIESIKKYNIEKNILLLGQRNDILDVYSSLDVYIMSSISEGFPNALAEAMACGIPAIATDVGEAKNIVGDCGWVINPNDRKSMSDSIINIIDVFQKDKIKWEDRRWMCHERVRTLFSMERMIYEYEEIWGN